MKVHHKIILITAFFAVSILTQNLFAQTDLSGAWEGVLAVNEKVKLRIVFNLSLYENESYNATLDSPDQGAKGIPVEGVKVRNDSIFIDVKAVGGKYIGRINGDQKSINGIWNQGGQSFELLLILTEEIVELKRRQEPKPPFPYKSEEVKFRNDEDNLTLAGTITLPNEGYNFPAVILISGSGPQNRDEELMGHKPFLVLADHLTKNGFAVLRFDDRGVGESTGDFKSATTKDFVKDVLAAVSYLKSQGDIDTDKIGLIGHSEGGLIAPLAADQSRDVNFIALLAGPGVTGEEILYSQMKAIGLANGESQDEIENQIEFSNKTYRIIKETEDVVAAEFQIRKLFNAEFEQMNEEEKKKLGDPDVLLQTQLKIVLSPWFRFFLTYDPVPVLEKIKIPTLAIIGEKDLQVPYEENLEAIGNALEKSGNENYEIRMLPGLNHLFQTAETGSPLEYGKIEETISPSALNVITNWLNKITKEE